MKKKIIGIILSITSLSFASEVCEIGSNELMKQLVSNHPSIKMSQEIIKASKERIDSAFWGFFPTPSVDVSAKNSDRYTTVARLDQPIWTGGKLTSNYDIAQSKEKESLYELGETSFNLIENYFVILEKYIQSKSNIDELNIGLNNLLELKEMLERRIDSGISSTSDSELLKARIQQIRSDLILAQNRLKVSIMQLELILDKKLDCEIDLNKIILLHSSNIEDSINRLLSFHPSVFKINSQIQTAKYELENTKASIMPNLSLRGEHRRGDLYNENYDKENSNQSVVYLTFTASTNAGLSALSNIEAARIKVNELKFKKLTVEKELIDTVLNDYNNYEIAKDRIKILENSVASSQNVLDSYKRLFVAGKRQWLNLVDASRELMNYKIQLANVKTNKNILAYKLALKNGQINLLNGEVK
ncbi:hypothetical protein CRU99_11670 [Malaciobacter mytili]|uniref:TolC family protein n=1 Tax=Malaciobacter mytili TaxID=603050 RepID=UPI00100B8FD4|nr:TolC family protein [Malaciobacter mytili]RXI37608.1 hypothetical protein CRU99_11670 [Malaciobacter mytili]